MRLKFSSSYRQLKVRREYPRGPANLLTWTNVGQLAGEYSGSQTKLHITFRDTSYTTFVSIMSHASRIFTLIFNGEAFLG